MRKKTKRVYLTGANEAHTFDEIDKAIYYSWTRTLKVFSHFAGSKCTETVHVPDGFKIRTVNVRLKIKE